MANVPILRPANLLPEPRRLHRFIHHLEKPDRPANREHVARRGDVVVDFLQQRTLPVGMGARLFSADAGVNKGRSGLVGSGRNQVSFKETWLLVEVVGTVVAAEKLLNGVPAVGLMKYSNVPLPDAPAGWLSVNELVAALTKKTVVPGGMPKPMTRLPI